MSSETTGNDALNSTSPKVLNLSPFNCTLQFAYARELLNNTVPEISY